MRYLLLAVMLTCISMQASAMVVEPQKKSEHSVHHTLNSAPAKTKFAAPSKATMGFYQASTSDNFDMMDLYLQQGADINCRNCDSGGNTPLNMSLSRSYGLSYQSINWLVNHGADVNIANANGKTPLMLSIPISVIGMRNDVWLGDSRGLSQLMKLLLDNGAKATEKDIYGDSVLAYMTMFSNSGSNDLNQIRASHSAFTLALTSLLEHGANINSANNKGNTVLMDAAESCADFSVETLLANKADPAIKNKLGQTALDIAIEKATRSGQNSNCNSVVKLLHNPQHVQQVSSVRSNAQGGSNNGTTSSAPQNTSGSIYAGNYSGSFNGDDNGSFQVNIAQDGSIKLTGKSQRSNQSFTGNGKMGSDGSLGITLGGTSTGATFQGSINPKTGALYGSWKNSEQAGNFSGNKQGQPGNPVEALGSLLDSINKVLAP